jgi:glucose/arabinose dehydrogenase
MAVIVLCTGLLCAGCGGGGAPGGGAAPGGTSTPTTQVGAPFVLARNLEVPWAIAFLPGGDALVTERDSARLLRVTPQGRVSTVGTVPGVEPSGEGGLLGVAVSPSFGRDRLVYLYFSTGTDNRIARFRYAADGIGPLDAVLTGIRAPPSTTADAWPSDRTACCGRPRESTPNPAFPRTGIPWAARSCG